MTPTVESWITLAIQIPLVGLFIFFSMALIDKFLRSISEITKTFATSIETISRTFVDSSDKRDVAWREFFNQQRESNAHAIQNMAVRFSDEIRNMGKEIAELKGGK